MFAVEESIVHNVKLVLPLVLNKFLIPVYWSSYVTVAYRKIELYDLSSRLILLSVERFLILTCYFYTNVLLGNFPYIYYFLGGECDWICFSLDVLARLRRWPQQRQTCCWLSGCWSGGAGPAPSSRTSRLRDTSQLVSSSSFHEEF